MNINDSGIGDALKKIRVQVGGKPIEWIPRPNIRIDEDTESVDEIENLFSESGLLIKDNQPVFVYIRDHTVGGPYIDARSRKKLHFTVCPTLRKMDREGRFDRYRITNRSDDQYPIDVRVGWSSSKETTVALYPCQYCLGIVKYKCFSRKTMSRQARYDIVQSFSAKEALNLLYQHFDIFRRQMSSVKPSTLPTGYPGNWKQIAQRIKKDRGYICEGCDANLAEQRYLLDVHHLDGEKQNIALRNLKVLCKLCHAEEHPHYTVSYIDRGKILRARRTNKELLTKINRSRLHKPW
ncbi:MAG: HNH endonuclease [Gammaproteobacteria bacterium]|nr:HNH endonuclease [Gammaproteobacteria bacterium]